MPSNKEEHILIKLCVSLKDTLHRSCWKNFQVRVETSEIFRGCQKVTTDRRTGSDRPGTVPTAENF